MTVSETALKPQAATSCEPSKHLMMQVKTERYPSYTTTVLRCRECRKEAEIVTTPATERDELFRMLHDFTTEYFAE